MPSQSPSCDHCGDVCRTEAYAKGDKHFCCNGCRTVYELLSESGLEGFYADGAAPGTRIDASLQERYAYLEEPKIADILLLFANEEQAKVRLHLPTIHCSSCLWLLEHLSRLHSGVLAVRVDFARRQALISFVPSEISLRQLAELLHSIGYPPQIDLSTGDTEKPSSTKADKSRVLKIGITGFLFGNIMLLSFPEYLSTGNDLIEGFAGFFAYLNLALSLPVLFYGASEFFKSSLASLRHRSLTIDVPIAIGILVIFLRSLYEIFSGMGPGYLDSMAGLVFFLLIGRWYQAKVYDNLSFDRDYRSFFPLSVLKISASERVNVPVMDLEVDDQIEVLSQGIVPADCALQSAEAELDYSFVTGESRPVRIAAGESIYAGAKNLSGRLNLVVKKKVSQSYLTDLWNQAAFDKEQAVLSTTLDKLSGRFTAIVLSIAAFTAVFWYYSDSSVLMDAVTAVLIVACPCALALSVPFALGNVRRVLSKRGLFSKSTQAIEELSQVDTIVFDKTGTLTHKGGTSCEYQGEELSAEQIQAVTSLVRQSAHPHSLIIYELLADQQFEPIVLSDFEETEGQGISAKSGGIELRLGSTRYVGAPACTEQESASWLSIDGRVLGRYVMTRELREGMSDLIASLRGRQSIVLLSGDNDAERGMMHSLFDNAEMHFEQSPADKLEFIHKLQSQGQKVMMIGDGLNDAGALKQANVGIALADDVSQFTPACDAILQGHSLEQLADILAYGRYGLKAVRWSVVFSLIYNIVGISFAVQGLLTPLIAAILMPLSSVTVVGFATLMTSLGAKSIFANEFGTVQKD